MDVYIDSLQFHNLFAIYEIWEIKLTHCYNFDNYISDFTQ
jgi:hypothetical protein